jgi:hypothetical protein
MESNDSAREFLKLRGCGDHIVEGGLEGLVENWENIVQSVAGGYSLGLDDYLNDMDVRQLIEEAMDAANKSQRSLAAGRIETADKLILSSVEPAGGCLWGDEVAEEEGWTAQKNWWYFSRPIAADPDLLAEIDESLSAG